MMKTGAENGCPRAEAPADAPFIGRRRSGMEWRRRRRLERAMGIEPTTYSLGAVLQHWFHYEIRRHVAFVSRRAARFKLKLAILIAHRPEMGPVLNPIED